MAIRHYKRLVEGVHMIWVQNNSKHLPLFKTDDREALDQRWEEINADIRKSSRVDVCVALYRFAHHHGCVSVWKHKRPAAGVLKVKPDGGQWLLVLARGPREVILQRKDTVSEVKDTYLDLMKRQANDPSLFDGIWDYAVAKFKLEVRDAQ